MNTKTCKQENILEDLSPGWECNIKMDFQEIELKAWNVFI
jgi:hypothetical protein